jgi:hypothetical protein
MIVTASADPFPRQHLERGPASTQTREPMCRRQRIDYRTVRRAALNSVLRSRARRKSPTTNEHVEAARSQSPRPTRMAAIVARRASGESGARSGLADAAGPQCAEASVFDVCQPSRCRSERWASPPSRRSIVCSRRPTRAGGVSQFLTSNGRVRLPELPGLGDECLDRRSGGFELDDLSFDAPRGVGRRLGEQFAGDAEIVCRCPLDSVASSVQ